MLSSDAWFFYDLDRIEPLNALKYAAHATYLTELACGRNVSEELLPHHQPGAQRNVQPARRYGFPELFLALQIQLRLGFTQTDLWLTNRYKKSDVLSRMI